MIALRWTLGLILAGLGGGFIVLSIVASGFRKSFGASPVNPLITILPVVAMIVLLAGLVWPANRALMHTGAIAALALIAFCVYLMISGSAVVVWFGVFYLAAWLWFYWKTARGA